MSAKVSIITVVYNGEDHLQQTINSVIAQDYQNIEYIVVDGNSTDSSVSIIEKNEAHISKWVSESDKGIYDAMNKGVQMASGEIIGLLNADDTYPSDAISKVVKAFEETSAQIVFGNMVKTIEIDGEQFEREEQPNQDVEALKTTMTIFHPATFVKKEVYDSIGLFDTKFRISADYEFLVRAFLKGIKFKYIDETLSHFSLSGVSNSNCDSYEEGYQIQKMYDLPAQEEMAKLIAKCKRKKLIHGVAGAIPGSKKIIAKRRKRNWNVE